jgi:peptide/nickel transport system substrate-binding protein
VVDSAKMTVIRNPQSQVDDIEQGTYDWMQNPPPSSRYAEVKEKYEGTQFRVEPTISTYYFWMNTEQPPFDDVRVRRAVNYALDPAALERIYAGTLKRTQQVLPSQMPGYRQFELYPHDLERAKALVRRADPPDREVTIWTNNLTPNDEAGEYYQQVLNEIGLDAKLKTVDAANYFTVIGNASTPDLDTGWANWFLDYPHPSDYFQPQLSSESIASVGNTNWARFGDARIDAQINRLERRQLGPRQEAEYAALDREVMEQAPWAPFGTLTLGTFVADTVNLDDLVVSPIYGQDLTSFELE